MLASLPNVINRFGIRNEFIAASGSTTTLSPIRSRANGRPDAPLTVRTSRIDSYRESIERGCGEPAIVGRTGAGGAFAWVAATGCGGR
jgi:hypothetical protein